MSTSFNLVSSTVSELQGLLGELPDAVITADKRGKVEFLNQAAERLTGYTGDDALGRALGEVLPLRGDHDGRHLESPLIACIDEGSSVGPLEARLRGRRSRRPVLSVSAAPIRESEGAITGLIVVARDVTLARRAARRLSHEATHDALTGLVNRAEFERRLGQGLASGARDRARHALGFLDLDGFKRVNDRCGHLAGDQLLQRLSALLRECVRSRDTVARLGGDEFGVLLEHCSPGKAVRIAEEIRKSCQEFCFTFGENTYRIGVSLGIVPLPGDVGSAAEALSLADAACYEAKRQGGNRVRVNYPPKVHDVALADFPGLSSSDS